MNLIAAEKTGAEWPESWRLLSHGIRTGRYTDPAFLKLEFEKLWTKVWQAAARLDEIPEPGDYTTYNIGKQSVVITRVDENTIKAFHNVCPHRGTALTEGGCGHFEKNRIICPFHGWRWDLQGNNQFVLERHEFKSGQLEDKDVALREVQFEIFAGFIFINFDKDPIPFEDFISPVKQILEDLALPDMRNYWWKAIAVPANWKVAQEAFFEGYHVPATHPQLEVKAAEVVYGDDPNAPVEYTHHNIETDAFEYGHGRFYAGKNTAMQGKTNYPEGFDPVDAMADRLNLLAEGMDAQVLKADVEIARSLKGKEIPEGSTLGAEFVKALYTDAAMKQRPMPKPDPEVLAMWGGEFFIFPNLLILPNAGNAMIYRVMPDALDPDKCTFEIMSTKTYPAAEPVPRAICEHVEDYLNPEKVLEIPRQDLGNIPRMQKGLHSLGCKQIWLAENYEKMIMNMHREMDKYLGAPEG